MRRKKTTGISKNILTKYYKAIYTNGDSEVFIGSDVASAALYAMGKNSCGRILEAIKEYDDIIKALTDY